MIPTQIQLTLRIPKGSPLTPAEVDENFMHLRDAITAIAEAMSLGNVVIGDEPPLGERPGTIWIPSDFGSINVWNSGTSTWVNLAPKQVINSDDSGSGQNFIITVPAGISNYADLEGRVIIMRALHSSVGASKLKVKKSDSTLIDSDGLNFVNHYLGQIEKDDIVSGQKVMLVYSVGQFQLLTPTPPIRLSDFRNVFTYKSNLASIPSSGGLVTFTHGLTYAGNPVVPDIVQLVLKRKTSDFTHVSGLVIKVGTEVDAGAIWSTVRGSENEWFWPVARILRSATDIQVQFYYPAGAALTWSRQGQNDGSGQLNMGSIQNGDDGPMDHWDIRVTAIAFNPDQLGAVTSSGALVSGSNLPVITIQPASESVGHGTAATFSVTATYGISVQWNFDGSDISGSRFSHSETTSGNTFTSTLTVTGTSASDTGKLVHATVSNAAGSATSATATLTVT